MKSEQEKFVVHHLWQEVQLRWETDTANGTQQDFQKDYGIQAKHERNLSHLHLQMHC